MNKLQICNSNALYFKYPFYTFLDIQKQLDIKAVELWGNVPHLWIDHIEYENCDWIKNELSNYGLKLVTFTPNPYNYSLCSKFDTAHRQNSLNYYKNCIEVATKLGALYVCIGPTGGEFDESYENLWNYYKQSLIEICDIAQKYGIKILIETSLEENSKIINTLPELEKIFNEVNSNRLKIVLNTHSMSMAGETINDWFKAFGDNIVYTHFIDGRYSGSRIWGEGCYPLEKYLYDLGVNNYSGYLGQLVNNENYHQIAEKADVKNILYLKQYMIGG